MLAIVTICAFIAMFAFGLAAVEDFDDEHYCSAAVMGIASIGMFAVGVVFVIKFFGA